MEANGAMKRISPRLCLFAATVAAMLFGFRGMFLRVADAFTIPQEDMSFGWFVPLFSLYVLWTQRRELKAAAGRPSLCAVLVSIPFVALALLGTRGVQMRFEQIAFIGLCVTLPWAFFGRAVARLCVFPAAYLAFTIPLATFLDVVTIHLRLLASGAALAVINGFGVDAVRQGTAIVAGGAHPFSIDVAEPCSGLRSLFALMALTAAYAWFHQPTWWRRAALFACSIPLAVLGNVVRILTICLVAAGADPAFATGFYHDYSGFVVFFVAILCMLGCGELISRLCDRPEKANGASPDAAEGETRPAVPPAVPPASPAVPSARLFFAPVLAFALVCAMAAVQRFSPPAVLAEPPRVALPESIPGCRADGVRYCSDENCTGFFHLSQLKGNACLECGAELIEVSPGEKRMLPKDTVIVKRAYRNAAGVEFLVSAIVGGSSKSSIHRPELCLPAQGFIMSDPRNVEIAGWPFHVVQIARGSGRPNLLAYTFFNQAGVRTASHSRRILVDTTDRTVFNRIDRWVMVTVNAMSPQGFALDDEARRGMLEEVMSAVMREMETVP